MPAHQGLELRGPHLVARRIDHSLHPICNEEITILISVAQIARAQKALPLNYDDRLLVRLWIIPIAPKQLGAMNDDFAVLARCRLGACIYVNHPRVDTDERDA